MPSSLSLVASDGVSKGSVEADAVVKKCLSEIGGGDGGCDCDGSEEV